MLPDFATIDVVEATLPPHQTITDYRRLRPRKSWLARHFKEH